MIKQILTFLVGLLVITWQAICKARESLSIVAGLAFLIYVAPHVRDFDPGAAPVDLGVLVSICYGVVALLIIKRATWWIINMIWPMFARYSKIKFESDFKNLTTWQRVKVYLLFYSSVVASLAYSAKMFL